METSCSSAEEVKVRAVFWRAECIHSSRMMLLFYGRRSVHGSVFMLSNLRSFRKTLALRSL